jgi:hypothetical protein
MRATASHRQLEGEAGQPWATYRVRRRCAICSRADLPVEKLATFVGEAQATAAMRQRSKSRRGPYAAGPIGLPATSVNSI